MTKMGFDFEGGRLDESTHPFMVGLNKDIRVTAVYNEQDLTDGLFAVTHETGHALYEQNLPASHSFTPVGRANGAAIHESQALFMECHVGGSQNFLHHLHSEVVKYCPDFPYTRDEFCDMRRAVVNSSIRVFADEVTYPLHIILRYEIEKSLFDGSLLIEDIKEAKNSKIILVNGSPQDLMKANSIRFYFDQQGVLVQKFGIKQVPATVSQHGSKLLIKEIFIEGSE
jgi:carboxypeptidase Taq